MSRRRWILLWRRGLHNVALEASASAYTRGNNIRIARIERTWSERTHSPQWVWYAYQPRGGGPVHGYADSFDRARDAVEASYMVNVLEALP